MPEGIAKYGPVYTLEAKNMGTTPGLTHEDHPIGLVETNAVAGLAATDRAKVKAFRKALRNTPIPPGQYRYHDGMLYMMSPMHCGLELRVWGPKGED